MNTELLRLYQSAQAESRLVIGLMSGTSLDGLDVALCRIRGAGTETEVDVLEFTTCDYDQTYRQAVREVFSLREVDLQQVTLLNAAIGRLHGEMVRDCLARWGYGPEQVDLIASHGQTIYHCPRSLHGLADQPNATLQIGDGDHIACTTGIITLSDFRQRHIAAGGEGAPLAVYGDYLMFHQPGENRILLNMGGIANFTFLAADGDPAKVFSTDVGPGNTLMDAYVQRHFAPMTYDKDSQLALAGKVNPTLLTELKENEFFSQPVPKTTGPELFNLDYLARAQQRSGTENISHQDVLATLNRFSADTIVAAIKDSGALDGPCRLLASGGGWHNTLLMDSIREQLPDVAVDSTASVGVDPDAKEAVLFAVLANECIAGGQSGFGNPARGIPDTSMGKISFPR
ncbi:Anhydro-N-acetylmuramic acid kinase [Saliniradius amylolyticus]|uniref:Anhydro-N-acetylmuramic acid kinase n=1 Tax=Saliniradius amylolyticus TaxID=2183582 RepID=A0A2S2E581_9ALTE|nr:anhydro-N-acetylmuramic acid kinase [Saliniradius amylolyticus]AWL12390.1 Anhydro-N-acetylmuramic acid kinase [Saliniradius amylolyticus]